MYFSTKILAQFAKAKIMMIGKILNTEKINLNFKPQLNYVREESYFLGFKVFILIFNAEKTVHVHFTNFIISGVIMKSVLLTSEARMRLIL